MRNVCEKEMLEMLDSAKSVGLVEPSYVRKYPPLALMKISSYCKARGKDVFFNDFGKEAELYCITSLFTYDISKVFDSIDKLIFMNPDVRILLGGVCASLMPKEFERYDICLFTGNSLVLDYCVPDYGINWNVEEPWGDFSFTFTSRGCPNRCPYCSVWRIEPQIALIENWRDHLNVGKKYAMISDNNLSSTPKEHLYPLLDYLAEKKIRTVFDNGFDCKHITEEMAQKLGKMKYVRTGMRLAFDRIEEDGVFQKAVQTLIAGGVSKSNIMAYVLFNFNDTPVEAFYRMSECRRLGIRPYPQQYQPLMWKTRDEKFIGKHWNRNLLRVFRYYWLMAGIYSKMGFRDFLFSDKNKTNLSNEELESFSGIENWRSQDVGIS